jgi:hypothetical protein
MDAWEWTPTAAFFVGVGAASLAAAFLAILVKIAINDHRARFPDGGFSTPPAPSWDSGVRSMNQRLQAIEERLATIERLQRQQLEAVHDTLPST